MIPACTSSRILLRLCCKTYMHNISFGPNLYKCLVISVKSATRTTSCFFCCVVYESGDVPVVKKWMMSWNWSSTISMENNYASGRQSSKLIGSSPDSILDKWSGPAFNLPGFTMTSKSYSWKRRSHLQIFPPNTTFFTRYLRDEWSVNILKWEPSK